MLVAKDFRSEAWKKLSGKWGTAAVTTLVYEVILAAVASTTVFGIGAVAGILVSGPLAVGFSIFALSIIRCQETKIEYLFYGFKNFVNTFVLALVNSIFIFLWSLLFIVPGIIKALSYSMSYYIIADNPDMTPTEARNASIELMNGNKGRLFCLYLSFIGWIILSALTFGILTFWVVPYIHSAEAAFYESIRPQSVSEGCETYTDSHENSGSSDIQ